MYLLWRLGLIVAVTIVCHTETVERISAYTASLPFKMTIKVDAPSTVEDNLGSADVLRLLSESITVSPAPNSAHVRTTLSYYRAIHSLLSHQQISSHSIPLKIPLQRRYSSTPPKTKT